MRGASLLLYHLRASTRSRDRLRSGPQKLPIPLLAPDQAVDSPPVDLYAVDAATVYGLGILEQLRSWPSTYRSSFDGRRATA